MIYLSYINYISGIFHLLLLYGLCTPSERTAKAVVETLSETAAEAVAVAEAVAAVAEATDS